MNVVATSIKNKRERLGLTQKEFADKFGVSVKWQNNINTNE